MRMSCPAVAMALFCAAAAASCGAPEEPTYGPPNSIKGRTVPEPLSDGGGGTTAGATAGGTPGGNGGTTAGADGGPGGATGASVKVCTDALLLPPDATCAVKFSTEIYPKMGPDGPWKCATGGCHLDTTDPKFPAGDPAAAWNAMRAYKAKGGGAALKDRHYMNPCSKNLDDSYFRQNMDPSAPLGTGMPLVPPGTKATAQELTAIETWVKCGSPNN